MQKCLLSFFKVLQLWQKVTSAWQGSGFAMITSLQGIHQRY
jgi:hypothetical protein